MNNKNIFILLLPLFFVLHGFTQNYRLVTIRGALLLLIGYIAFSLLVYSIFKIFSKDITKRITGTLLFLLFFFFFGAFQDLVSRFLIWHYTIMMPLCLLLLFFAFRYFSGTRWVNLRTTRFLNLLLIVLIAVEGGLLVLKVNSYKNKRLLVSEIKTRIINNQNKPDIFLILCDEYAGNESLLNQLGLDNSQFTEQLKTRGFSIIQNSNANYNSTPFSMASLFNMDYLFGLNGSHKNISDLNQCYHSLRTSRVVDYLTSVGYKFYNLSPFQVGKQKAISSTETFLPKGIEFINDQTLFGRLRRDLAYHILQKLNLAARENRKEWNYNEEVLANLNLINGNKSKEPRFVYAHLMMPHYPYYFDRTGKPYNIDSIQYEHNNQQRYKEYILFTNGKLLSIIDNMPANSVIILMGDHGFRQWAQPLQDSAVLYNNFKAIKLPGAYKNDSLSGRSNVNLFRSILNSLFQQDLPLLKDSTVLITNKE